MIPYYGELQSSSRSLSPSSLPVPCDWSERDGIQEGRWMQGIVLDRSRLCTLSTAASDRPPVKDICSVVITLFRGLLLDIMLKVGICITTLLPWRTQRVKSKNFLNTHLCNSCARPSQQTTRCANCCTTSITNTGRGHNKLA